MNKGLYILNGLLLVLVAVLFYLHFAGRKGSKNTTAKTTAKDSAHHVACKIAYFEMDSIEASFGMVKQVKAELNRKEEAMNNELTQMEKTYRNKVAQYQAQGASMNQVQSENDQRDVLQMQQQMASRKQSLDQEYQDYYMRRMKDVKTKIEDFLRDYNSNKQYAYIVAYEPGLFYYRDTLFNITGDVIKGLNERYTKKK